MRAPEEPEQMVADRLGALPHVDRVVLFGSRARGDGGQRADIDLAVACPGAGVKQWSDIVETAEKSPTLLQIDLVRLETAPADLRERILREGRVLYERDGSGAQA